MPELTLLVHHSRGRQLFEPLCSAIIRRSGQSVYRDRKVITISASGAVAGTARIINQDVRREFDLAQFVSRPVA
jgi:hypothetical protein